MKKTLICGLLLLFASPGWAQALDPDFQILKSVGVEPNGPALLKYFKDRSVRPDSNEMARLVRQLGDDSFQVRENAQKQILNIGSPSLAALKLAETDADVEISVRAEHIIRLILAKAEPAVEAAAARLLAAIHPPGAAEVLINYLPSASDQNVSEELAAAIKATAVREGKADPAVVKALGDALPIKRIVAAEALFTYKEELPAIRKLLQDPSPQVRLRVALSLVAIKEKEAVPVLVELLGVLNPSELWQAEEVLINLAGNEVPTVPLGNNEEGRKKCRDAWQTWLTKNAGKIDLAKLGEAKTLLGYTLIVQQAMPRAGGLRQPGLGCVMELDRDKKERWRFDVTTHAVDAQVLRHDHVLVAEFQGMRVTERDFSGKVLWEQNVGGNPIGVQGLPNGNVFVVVRNKMVEYDRNHKEVFVMHRPGMDVFRARKLRNGDVIYITNAGQVTRMDANQRVLKNFNVGNFPILFGSIDILPGGGVLVPEFHVHRVVEYDAEGKSVMQINVQFPNSVMRLPNGHTLVGSQNARRVAEFDTRGQEVWAYSTEGILFNARKR